MYMYTPFSAGRTFGNQETKIILCAFSHSIYSSPIHNLFAVSFGMKSQKCLMQLSYLLFCSIAEQSMRLQSFAQWILPIPIQPFRDPGPSRISKLRLPPGAFLPSFLSIFSPYLSLLRSFFRGSIGKSRLDCVIEPSMSQSGKTRYRGRLRSGVFGLVYQKPWVIQMLKEQDSPKENT